MKSPYESALEAAKAEYSDLLRQRQEMDQRIVRLKQTIDGLTALCEEETDEEEPVIEVSGGLAPSYKIGLTDAIRSVFETSNGIILDAKKVRQKLDEMGFDMKKKYVQPMVPVHNTLKRLEEQQELVSIRDERNNVIGYRWVTPIERAIANVTITGSIGGFKSK